MNEMTFYLEDEYLSLFIAKALEKYVGFNYLSVIFVFIGTDGNVGDSLAPLCGSLIDISSEKALFYGDLTQPITAKEVPFVAKYLKKAHPGSVIVVIDAAIGKKWDVGRVKVQNSGLKPGLGVNKNLPMVGDVSIIGVIGEKQDFIKGNYIQIRLSSVFKMAKSIAKGIEMFLGAKKGNKTPINAR